MKFLRKPDWLKIKLGGGENYKQVKQLVEENSLHTICSSGRCPNIGECWSRGTATLMILGDICTRSCKFCATKSGRPLPPDPNEPMKLARTVQTLKLRHVVITSVDRDDLPDFGATHWAETMRVCRKMNPETIIEVLLPDFQNVENYLEIVTHAVPDIISHNVETVRRLTPAVRSKADYDSSLNVLRFFSMQGLLTKSGFMLGLGETHDEILETIGDLYDAGCRILTIGQYLQPTANHIAVVEYIHPDSFEFYKRYALELGYSQVESAPLVRSSYMAEQSFSNMKKQKPAFCENVSMKQHHAFRMEVSAEKFIEISDSGQLPEVFLSPLQTPVLILGSGSNILFRGDFGGTIVKMSTKGILKVSESKENVVVRVAAGEDWDRFVEYCLEKGWNGLENLSFIPGTAGASVVQNIGAFGVEAADFVRKVEVFSRKSCSFQWKTAKECSFGYRDSRFKHDWANDYIVTQIEFELSFHPKVDLSYDALKKALSGREDITPSVVREEVIKIRTSRLPDVEKLGNAGSFFKNPVVSKYLFQKIQSEFPDVVSYPCRR
jgi:lipoyl synthase